MARLVDDLPFETASQIKKLFYARCKSFDELKTDYVENNNNILNNGKPHFVLRLRSLEDFKDADNKDDEQSSEYDLLRRLKHRLRNGQADAKLELMREKIASIHNVSKNKVEIRDIFFGTTNIAYIIHYDNGDGDTLAIVKDKDPFLKACKKTLPEFEKMVLAPPMGDEIKDADDGSSYHVIKTYHVSCSSDRISGDFDCNCDKKEHNLSGVVLYMKDNKTDWYCNGRHCKIGYIIVKQADKVMKQFPKADGIVHGATYESVFKEKPKEIVGSGFSRYNGNWTFNSYTFNAKVDKYHNDGKKMKLAHGKNQRHTMGEIEKKWVLEAVKQWWKTGKQNLPVKENIVIFSDPCHLCLPPEVD